MILSAIRKKSFELNYNGGTIWCEHLDWMGELEQAVIDKFIWNLPELMRPSVSSFMIINLDETMIMDAIVDVIVNGLVDGKKQFGRVAFVGVDRKHQNGFNVIHDRTGEIVGFWDDYEKAKEWVMG